MADKHLTDKEFNKEMGGLRKYLENNFTAIKVDIAVIQTDNKHQQEHIDALEKKSNRWDFINTIGVVIAGFIGSMINPNK